MIAAPIAAIVAAAAAVFAALWWRERARARLLGQAVEQGRGDLQHMEEAFARFAPVEVVERITGGARDLPAERRDVTVMFTDLVGFTRMSEQLDPALMVRILNGYFAVMHRAVIVHHGRVSRMMGDGLMALFGAIDHNPWHSQDAVRAALAMREALAEYNKKLAAESLPELRFGVGIHRGEVIAGVLGSDELMEFTVIGDPVNTAARVESLTRTHGVDILVTEEVRRELEGLFRVKAMPPVAVKGKAEPVLTFAVEGREE